MIIKFDEMQETEYKSFLGGGGALNAKIFNDGQNKILRGRLEKGCSIGLHTHETSAEIIYILSGNGKCLFDGVEEKLGAGDCHYCPKGSAHSLINDGVEDLCFFAVVPQQ
jgi:mannose-6-phosphate isomerase-like protein (cupin superfamily)